jgi:hypothetical protein
LNFGQRIFDEGFEAGRQAERLHRWNGVIATVVVLGLWLTGLAYLLARYYR